MNNIAIASLLLAVPALGISQVKNTLQPATAPQIEISVSATGTDVRAALADIFHQAKRNFVIAPDIHQALYLSLDKIDFDEALLVVCHTAKLETHLENGIYYVGKAQTAVVKTTIKPAAPMARPKAATPPTFLPKTVLNRIVSAKLTKTGIRDVFANLSKQSEVQIVVARSVPDYKITAFLNKTSLKYALDHVTSAARLEYRFTEDRKILIFSPNTVSLPNAKDQVSLDKG